MTDTASLRLTCSHAIHWAPLPPLPLASLAPPPPRPLAQVNLVYGFTGSLLASFMTGTVMDTYLTLLVQFHAHRAQGTAAAAAAAVAQQGQ